MHYCFNIIFITGLCVAWRNSSRPTNYGTMRTGIFLERLFALLLACFENLIHGAIIFGWPSFVFVFIQLGYFSDLCDESSENVTSSMTLNRSGVHNLSSVDSLVTCPEQASRLQLVFSVAVAIQATSMFPVGLLFDRFGTRISRLFMSFLMLIGYLMMAFSSPSFSFLVFPATICFTIGGVISLFSFMQIGNLFKGRKSTVITIINAMYSASVIISVIAKRAHEAGFSLNTFFFILAASVLLLNVNTFVFLPAKYVPWPLPEGYRLTPCRTPRIAQEKINLGAWDSPGCVTDPSEEIVGVNGGVNGGANGCQVGGIIESVEGHCKEVETHSIARDTRRNMRLSISEGMSRQISENGLSEDEERKRNQYESLSACLRSTPFCLLLLWQAFLEIDMIFTVGTLNFFLTRLADGDEGFVSWYTDVFALIQFLVLIVGPLGGLLMDRNNIVMSCFKKNKTKTRGANADMLDSCLPLAITTLASIGYSICVLIPSLKLQYLTFFLLLIVPSLLYGVGPAVVGVVFPMKYFASVYGAIRTISGFFTFLQYPIFIMIQKYLDGNPFYVTIGFIVADILTFLLPAVLYVRSRKSGD